MPQDETTGSESVLRESFRRAGAKYGYNDVDAQFVSFKEFKVRWQRSYRWADFKVSDYLSDAPEEVISDLAETIFGKICGENSGYSQPLKDWVTGPKFVADKQPAYLRRGKTFLRTPVGDHKNLADSYKRLCDEGLLTYDPAIYLTWAREVVEEKHLGHCSVLMKVVSVSKALDDPDVPDYVLDYTLYHELCHLALGFDPEGRKHAKQYDEMESRFPMMSDALCYLKQAELEV